MHSDSLSVRTHHRLADQPTPPLTRLSMVPSWSRRADLPRALNHACTALQPLAVQEGLLFDLGLGSFTHSFVYRQARQQQQQ